MHPKVVLCLRFWILLRHALTCCSVPVPMLLYSYLSCNFIKATMCHCLFISDGSPLLTVNFTVLHRASHVLVVQFWIWVHLQKEVYSIKNTVLLMLTGLVVMTVIYYSCYCPYCHIFIVVILIVVVCSFI